MDFLLIDFSSAQHVAHKVIGFRTSEVSILTYGVLIILLIALQQYIMVYVMFPSIAVSAIFLCQRHGICYVPHPGIICSQHEFGAFFRIGHTLKYALQTSDARILSSGSFSFPLGIPIARHVAGINCISPLAPAHDTTSGLKLDSAKHSEASKRQSHPTRGAYLRNRWS